MKRRIIAFLVCLCLLLVSGAPALAESVALSGTLKYMVWGSTVERDIVQGIVDAYNESHRRSRSNCCTCLTRNTIPR